MTTLREAAQQALEALEKATRYMSDAEIRKFNECAIALNAAMRAENKMRHLCSLDSPSDVYGIAMDICYEGDDETFWVSNDEYASQVNYCPVCGAKAPKQVEKTR